MRTSDRRRDRALAALGEGFAGGVIGEDTLALRVEAAHRARTAADLRRLTADLPVRSLHDALDRLRTRLAPAGPVVRIAPPPEGPGPWTIGRGPGCALAIDADSVSRTHAELRRCAGGWEVRDLGSTNGTWVNGWRVRRAVLREGDRLRLGEVRVELR